jgi:hypothetical protein
VYITDTLDLEKYDLTNFSFGSFGWGDTVVTQLTGVTREFLRDVDLRPAMPLIVRVTGKLDETTGVVKFDFVSLNPVTMAEEEDPMLGFLPPNGQNGEGEGFVSFTVGLKPITKTGQTVETQASIVFDANAPIITNVYTNTFDLDKPQPSSISGSIKNGNLELSWSGTDVGSGIAYYDVWIQKDDGEWESLLYHTVETSAVIPVESQVTAYKFYCIATDNAGWQEDETGSYQTVSTSIKDISLNKAWEIYPNPTNGKLYIESGGLQIEKVEIFDITGRTVFTSYETTIDLSQLSPGTYFVKLKTDRGELTKKVIKE